MSDRSLSSRTNVDVIFQRPTSGTVWVCPGPADEMEDCSYWQSAAGWCPYHPHIDLVAHNARQT